jgi:hypothetical protein
MRTASRLAVILGAVMLALVAGPAQAGSPHFIKNLTVASLVSDGPDLRVDFKEAGLESGSVETVVIAADLVGTYQCVNNGGHNPDDPKKTTIQTRPEASGEFTADKNGNIVGFLVLSPPAADAVLDCPNGQTATLTAFAWSNITIDDLDSGAHLDVRGTFSGGAAID